MLMYRKDFIVVFLIITGVSGLFAFQVFIVGFNASEQKNYVLPQVSDSDRPTLVKDATKAQRHLSPSH